MSETIYPIDAARNEDGLLVRWRVIDTSANLVTGAVAGDFTFRVRWDGTVSWTNFAIQNFAELGDGVYQGGLADPTPPDFTFGEMNPLYTPGGQCNGSFIGHNGAVFRGVPTTVAGAAITFPAGYVPRGRSSAAGVERKCLVAQRRRGFRQRLGAGCDARQ